MKIRILDRILVALAGLLLISAAALTVAQVLFQVDVVGFATRIFQNETTGRKALLLGCSAFALALGIYCLMVLFRHQGKNEKFVLQKTENGELAISIKALSHMVDKCLEQHHELETEEVRLENQRDGLLVRIRGNVAGGISIPLTIEALQKQIRQYVTACSGVEVKGVRVQIESSGEDATDAPFAIDPPSAIPLLREPEQAEKAEPVIPETPQATPEKENTTAPIRETRVQAPEVIPDEDDDRPMHQRIFSAMPEPCIVPAPPENAAPEEAEAGADAIAEAAAENMTEEVTEAAPEETEAAQIPESEGSDELYAELKDIAEELSDKGENHESV